MGNRQIKILAIDDNPDNLVILQALIKDAFPGAVTVTALNGQTGIDLAGSEDPDIILLDIVMPVMDGFSVCKKLKSDHRTNDIPVVFITAQKGDKESRIKAMEVGADAFLAKPIDENELTAQIRAMVKIKQANIEKRNEKERLAKLVDEKIHEQRKTYIATLNLLEDLARENEARKKNEEALRKSEESLADIFNTVNEGIIHVSLTGEVLSVNPAFEKIVEIPGEIIIGKNAVHLTKELLQGKSVERLIPVIIGVMKGKNLSGFQLEYKNKILEVNATINKQSGRITGVIRDITERIENEKKISMLAHAIRSISECISITDTEDNIVFVNNAFLKTYQYDKQEILGNSIKMVRSPNNPSRLVNAILPATLRGGWHGELLNMKKDGSEFPVFLSTSIIYNDNGKPIALIGVTTDITERKKAEEVLRKSEERFRSLVENAFDGIYLTNGKYFYFVNNKFCEITGYPEEELISPDFNFDVTLTDESVNIVNERSLLRQMGKAVAGTYDIQIRTKDGNYKYVEISTVNIGHGKELNVMGIIRDITERRRIESQIIQSERLSALGEMSAGMAHEINQPLNTLSILLDNILLEAKTQHGVTEDYLLKKSEKIFNNILRIRNLIDHVREFSRSHDGYILNLFSINQSIRNALSMVSEQFRIAGIELITHLVDDLPEIKGNTYKFEQVMLNFISNSKDALIEKKGNLKEPYPMFIKITTRFDKQLIYLEVEDNGIGIKQENIDKILMPFFTTKEPGKGTGLGLSITYGLIQEMKGKMSIQSKVLKGTTITVTIPVQI
jgi:PAS domain S-box-containing protein